MAKRVLLFLATNFLVFTTISLLIKAMEIFFGIRLPSGYTGLAIWVTLFGMGGAFFSLWISRWVAKRAYRIELVHPQHPNPQAREVFHMVERLAQRAGIPTPEVGVYVSPEPNAFATGPSKKSSLVAFSSGLLERMTPKEREAVAAHEIAHIANGDMVTMTLLTGIANALVMFVARIVAQIIDNVLRSDEGEGGLGFIGYFLVVMVLESVFMMLAYIPIAAFSRWREYRADAGAAQLTSPSAMAQALSRLKNAAEAKGEPRQFAMAKISSRKRVSLWSTHPSLDDRIQRLVARA
jgi:heat shock protein HtpX